MSLNWLLNKSWITKLELTSSVNYSNRLTTTNTNKSSSSSQAAIHSVQEGYYIAQLYDQNPNADIVLLEPGYWYQLSYYDSRPINYNTKFKAESSRKFAS